MANVTPSHLRGFLIPFAGFNTTNKWDASTVITQGSGSSGVPEPQQSSSLVLQARGSMSLAVDVATQSAGNIGLDTASFKWKFQTDYNYYGWEVPNKLCGIEGLTGAPPIGANSVARSTIKSIDGTILTCIEYTTVTHNYTKIYRTDLTGATTNITVDSVTITSLGGQSRFPTLCMLSDGSMVIIVWSVDDAADKAFLKSWRSTDDGLTWLVQSDNLFPVGESVDLAGTVGAGNTGFDLGRITAAADSHSVLIIAEVISHNQSVIRNQYYQLISYSQATKVQIVASPIVASPAQHFYAPTMIVWNGVFVVSYGKSSDSIGVVALTDPTISIAGQILLSSVTVLSMPNFNLLNNESVDGGRTMYIDSTGRIHLYCLHNNRTYMSYAYSDVAGIAAGDYGKTWNYMRGSTTLTDSKVLEQTTPGGTATTIKNITGVSSQGSQYIFCNGMINGGNPYEKSVVRYEFGGWRTIQYPQLVALSANDRQSGYNINEWIPTATPSDTSMWTKNVVGITTEALTGDAVDITNLALGQINYSMVPNVKTNGFLFHSQFAVTGTTGGEYTGIALKVQQTISTNTYNLEVMFTKSGIFVYDLNHAAPATPIASDTTLATWGGKYIVIVWLDNATGNLRVLYAEQGSPVYWKELAGTLILDPNTSQHIKWGAIKAITGAGTYASSWGFVSIGSGLGNGVGLTGISPLNGHRYSPDGYWAELKNGLKISTLDGVARENEYWKIDPEYTNGIDNILYDVAPTRSWGWVSNVIASPDSTNTPQEIMAWHVDADLKNLFNSVTTNSAIGLHLSELNFRSFTIETYNATTAAWVAAATVDNSVSGGMTFTRTGGTVLSSTTSGNYIEFGEAKNWKIQLDDGAGNVVVRTIKYNGDGVMGITASTTKQAKFLIENAQSTDPTSGTAHIIPSSCTVIFEAAVFSSLRITMPAQRTQEGCFKIGMMVLGECVIPGQQYSRGRSITFNADVATDEQFNGVLRSQKTGIGGRSTRIAWTEGVDTSQLNNSPATPDYYKLQTTGSVVASVGSAPSVMIGLIRHLSGSLNPLVYLPSLQVGTGAPIVLNRYNEHTLCTMGNDVEIQNVIGSELQGTSGDWGEVFRVGTVTLREIR